MACLQTVDRSCTTAPRQPHEGAVQRPLTTSLGCGTLWAQQRGQQTAAITLHRLVLHIQRAVVSGFTAWEVHSALHHGSTPTKLSYAIVCTINITCCLTRCSAPIHNLTHHFTRDTQLGEQQSRWTCIPTIQGHPLHISIMRWP